MNQNISNYQRYKDYLLIPIEKLVTPLEGDIVMVHRYWLSKDNCVLVYTGHRKGTWSPQCNKNLRIMERRLSNGNSELSIQYIAVAFLEQVF